MDHDPVAFDLFQDNEVIHIPMEDAGRLDVLETLRLQPQAAACHVKALRQRQHVLEGHAFHRNRELPPKRDKIRVVAVEGRHHRKACEPAFRSLGLQRDGKARAAGKIDLVEKIHIRPRALIRGFNSHAIRERCSRVMSACRLMSGCRGMACP